MRVDDQTVHHRRVFAHLDEKDLTTLLANHLAEKTGFVIDPKKTKVNVIISKKDRPGTAGFEPYAEVTLINDLDEVAGDAQ